MMNNEMINRANELRELMAMRNELDAMIETIKDEFKAYMDDAGLTDMVIGDNTIHYTEVKSNRFDSAAFKKDCREMYDAYCKENVTRRFSLT